VIDLRIREAYYRGHPLELPPRAFRLLALLASRSGRPVSKAEIYEHLWPESRSSAADERPYERQIADHKRKLMTRLRALARTAPGLSQEEVERLILMKPRRGYLLNLAAQVSPVSAGGMVFALLTSFSNLGLMGSDVLGGFLFPRIGLKPLIAVSAFFTFCALAFVPYVSGKRMEQGSEACS